MNRKNMAKRLTALFLSIIMILGVVPTNVFAEEAQPATSTRDAAAPEE